MADDKTYRPQKKNISHDEIGEGADDVVQAADVGNETAPQEQTAMSAKERAEAYKQSKGDAMDDGRNVRDAAHREVHGESPQEMQNPMNNPNPGFQVSGNVPPAFQQAMANKGRNQGPGEFEGEVSKQNRMQSRVRPRKLTNESMKLVGSSKLQELLEGIKDTTTVYDEIELPSKGRFYDGSDGPTDGIIHIRPMTGEEEQILATPRFVKKGQAINMIFDRCIQENYKSENFVTQDRTYLLIYLRGISYTPQYDVDVKCPFTDKQFQYTINLDTLWVDPCPEDFNQESLQGKLPVSGYSFEYRLSRGSDEQRVQDYRDLKVKGNFMTKDDEGDDTLLYRTSLLLDNIEGLSKKAELQHLLSKLPIADVSYLRNLVNEPPFGVDTTVEIISPFTSEEFEIELPLEANFFFPRAKKETSKEQA